MGEYTSRVYKEVKQLLKNPTFNILDNYYKNLIENKNLSQNTLKIYKSHFFKSLIILKVDEEIIEQLKEKYKQNQ